MHPDVQAEAMRHVMEQGILGLGASKVCRASGLEGARVSGFKDDFPELAGYILRVAVWVALATVYPSPPTPESNAHFKVPQGLHLGILATEFSDKP